MSKTNYIDLDGQILRTFLTILETSSVSTAAERLGVTQSAVSHTLAKLRRILGDPLFVRSGQGLTPTETAISLKEPVQKVLDGLKGLTDQRTFNPRSEAMRFIIAANDMQRELIFPQLLREARADGISLSLDFIPSGVPSVAMLRDASCQLMVTPVPPDAPDVFQKHLLDGEMMCFYDSEVREAPASWEEYRRSEYIAVRFAGGRGSLDRVKGIDPSQLGEPTVTVSNFAAIPAFVQGSTLIATQMDLMRLGPLKDLTAAPLPFATDPAPLYMAWHERSTNDPAHIWLRHHIERIATQIRPRLRALS